MALIVDDVLGFPVRALMWVFRELHSAAEQEIEGESESITNQLSELYMMLETGELTEVQFEERESGLLDKLDELERRGEGP